MTDAGTSGAVAAVSAVLLETIGVDAYTITMACIGAVIFQASATQVIGRTKAIFQVCVGGVIGALAAQAGASDFNIESRSMLMLSAAFFGYAYFRIFDALAQNAERLIGRAANHWGGK